MKILVLEDDPVSMKKISSDLISFGHEVLEATDSVEALNVYYDNDDVEVIITDLEMPFGSGEDFVRDIRSLRPKLPIIVISGTVSKDAIAKLKKYKCKDIIVKPHNKDRLNTILESI